MTIPIKQLQQANELKELLALLDHKTAIYKLINQADAIIDDLNNPKIFEIYYEDDPKGEIMPTDIPKELLEEEEDEDTPTEQS